LLLEAIIVVLPMCNSNHGDIVVKPVKGRGEKWRKWLVNEAEKPAKSELLGWSAR
jgi:hypothetical protein